MQSFLATLPDLGFVEVHAENCMGDGGPLHHALEQVRARYPLSLHGVGLSLGGEAPPDAAHLARLAGLVSRYAPASFSEHLAWSAHGGVCFNDLLPVAYDAPTLARVCSHVQHVQDTLGLRMLLENPATYVEFEASTMDEPDFLSEVLRRTGCGLLLDLTNLHVSCTNHGRDALACLHRMPLHAVREVHLAGFALDSDAAGAPLLIDNHGSPVDDVVWQLFEHALRLLGPVPTLLERDNQVPPLATLVAEAGRAEALLKAA
jgi:uncharacterized protein (UPF0276 family)